MKIESKLHTHKLNYEVPNVHCPQCNDGTLAIFCSENLFVITGDIGDKQVHFVSRGYGCPNDHWLTELMTEHSVNDLINECSEKTH